MRKVKLKNKNEVCEKLKLFEYNFFKNKSNLKILIPQLLKLPHTLSLIFNEFMLYHSPTFLAQQVFDLRLLNLQWKKFE